MANDIKYGEVTIEHGTLLHDEPVVVFRSTDKILPKLLAYYHMFCMQEGSNLAHLNLILASRHKVQDWQAKNWNKVKTPDTDPDGP